MANTYIAIATASAPSGNVSEFTFSSIPSTYTDLVIMGSLRTTRSNYLDDIYYKFNTSTANQSGRIIYSDGSATPAGITSYLQIGFQPAATATSSYMGSFTMYIPNYGSSANKCHHTFTVSENASSSQYGLGICCDLWSNTSAITSTTIYTANGNLVQHSFATLYGIKKN